MSRLCANSPSAFAEPRIIAFGSFGSYVRGNCGVGSDVDLVAIIEDEAAPPGEGALLMRKQEMKRTHDILLPVLRHRIITNFNAEADGVTTDDIIRSLVDDTPVDDADADMSRRMDAVMR